MESKLSTGQQGLAQNDQCAQLEHATGPQPQATQQYKFQPGIGRLGLTQEYPDPNDKKATRDASVDIIALHGLATSGPKQWIAWMTDGDPKSGDVYWLKDNNMLPSVIPDCRILSYNWSGNYAGNIAKIRFIGEADTMLNRIHEERKKVGRSSHPIVFIASCFGGLLLAKTLARASEESHPIRTDDFRRILDVTVGIAFLGTPFRGSWSFGYANAQAIIKLAERENVVFSQELVQYLRLDSRSDAEGAPSPLDESVQRFTELVNHDKFRLPVICFYETEETKYDSYTKKLPENFRPEGFNPDGRGMPVNEGSASIDGFERVAIYRRHSMMSKYNSPEDDGFIRISQKIKGLVDNANDTLSRKAYHYRSTITLFQATADYLMAEMFDTKQDENYKQCQIGTCQSFLQSPKFLEWRKSSHSSTLFCPGIPGAGKTVFASSVISHLSDLTSKDRGSVVAYVYCDYVKDKQNDLNGRSIPIQTAEYFLKSLLKQLMLTSTILPQQVLDKFSELKRSQSQPKVNEVEEAITQVAATFSHVFIVVDALDECHPSEAKKLINALFRIQSSQRVHLIVTSRFIDEIQELFKEASHLPIQASNEDVALYVQNHISDISRFLDDKPTEMKNEVVDVISKYSEGMFLLAYLYLHSLEDKLKNDEIKTALNDIRIYHNTSQRPRNEAQMKALLEDAYDRTLAMINSRKRGFAELAKKALTWVAFTYDPLSKTELQEAVAIEIGADSIETNIDNLYDFREINKACAGLLRLEQGYVRLVHYTTQAYIKANIDKVGAGMSIRQNLPATALACRSERRSHRSIALSYMTCLICAKVDGYPEMPLFYHATRFWVYHASYISFKDDKEAVFLLTKLFNDDEKVFALDYRIPRELKGQEGAAALHLLIHYQLPELIKVMLSGPDTRTKALLSSTFGRNYTPLCHALVPFPGEPDVEVVKLLLEKGADPEHISDDGPPLAPVGSFLDVELIELLLEKTTLGAVDVLTTWAERLEGLESDEYDGINWLINWLVQRNIVDPSEISKWGVSYWYKGKETLSPLMLARKYKDIEATLLKAKEVYDASHPPRKRKTLEGSLVVHCESDELP